MSGADSYPATCDCGHRFTVPKSLIGGLANCPRCGKATSIEGLHDPIWKLLGMLSLLVWAAATTGAYQTWGVAGAVAATGITLVLLALIRLAF